MDFVIFSTGFEGMTFTDISSDNIDPLGMLFCSHAPKYNTGYLKGFNLIRGKIHQAIKIRISTNLISYFQRRH